MRSNPSSMNILKYTPAFREQCIAIFESNLPKYFAPEEKQLFIDWLDNGTAVGYYVVEINEQIIACGGIYLDQPNNEGGLSWGMVHAAWHKQGIGKQFAQHRIELLKATYPARVYRIETSQHTAPFYEKLGFKTAEIIKNGFGEGLDKYNMSLE